ncbi:MAG TPA: hypothetical protein VK338_01585, partial [Candidatus Nitrosocosmicus sp.]|nr:hypothetical protein [Candidatus Nitrosocosmicus sp.]
MIVFYLLKVQLPAYLSNKEQINQLKAEITNLQQRKNIIYSFNPGELQNLTKTLNTLLPSQEDFFSIFSALERVASKSGFKVTSYTVNFSDKTTEKVSLTIHGEGTPNELLNFIEQYKFSGGRLMTMDNVQFSPSTTKTELKINFYSKKTAAVKSGSVTVDKK